MPVSNRVADDKKPTKNPVWRGANYHVVKTKKKPVPKQPISQPIPSYKNCPSSNYGHRFRPMKSVTRIPPSSHAERDDTEQIKKLREYIEEMKMEFPGKSKAKASHARPEGCVQEEIEEDKLEKLVHEEYMSQGVAAEAHAIIYLKEKVHKEKSDDIREVLAMSPDKSMMVDSCVEDHVTEPDQDYLSDLLALDQSLLEYQERFTKLQKVQNELIDQMDCRMRQNLKRFKRVVPKLKMDWFESGEATGVFIYLS